MNVIVLFIQLILITLTEPLPPIHKCWSKNMNDIGHYRNFSYQLHFMSEDSNLELQCRECGSPDPHDVNIYWKKVDVTLNTTYESSHFLNREYKALHKRMKILDNTSLYIKKIQTNHAGLYNCYINSSSHEDSFYDENTLTSHSETYSYFIHVYNKKSHLLNGTYTEWNYFEDYVYRSSEKVLQSIPIINQIFRPMLIAHWTDWGNCLCGKYTYDTRSYRYAYCCIKIYHELILPCQSLILKELSPEISKVVETVSNFKEYRRCMDDCVPAAMEEEVDFKIKKTYYMREASHLEVKCLESENSTDIVWIGDDNMLINKTKNAKEGNDRIEVDDLNTLYLTDVSKHEEGYYSCIVNGVPLMKILIRIEPMNLIFTKACGYRLIILSSVIVLWIIIFLIIECYNFGKTGYSRFKS